MYVYKSNMCVHLYILFIYLFIYLFTVLYSLENQV